MVRSVFQLIYRVISLKLHILTFSLLIMSGNLNLIGQRVINYEQPVKGDIELAENVVIPKRNPGYTLWLPEKNTPSGLLVFMHERRDTLPEFIIDYACSQHLGVMYTTTDNPVEFFFDSVRMQEIEDYIYEVVTAFHIPKNNLFYSGMSLAGTRAVKLAQFAHSAISKHHLIPKAIAICDAPLDMVRFYPQMMKAKKLSFNAVAANEGYWVSSYLEQNLGGTPSEVLTAYVNYSPFSYSAIGGPHVDKLMNIAIRCYTEPDVNWWIETRRKDYYGINAIDLAALINELKIRGHNQAELIITQNKGYLPDGSRHPHSWSIVDEKELVDWFLKLIK